MKKIIFIFSILLLSWCVNTQNTDIDFRTINDEENKQMTGFILFQKDPINWIFKFKQKNSENEYDIISKSFDLSYYEDREIFVAWKQIDKFIEITEIKEIVIETEISLEPYNILNDLWWYSFTVDETRYKAIKWGNKTMVRNSSWELILNIFIFDDSRQWNEPLISDNSKQFLLNWIKWEKKDTPNWFNMWLINNYYEKWNLINLKANYWIDYENNKTIILEILASFKLIPKKIQNNINCWWEWNLICPKWYICELTWEDEFSKGECVPFD